jgi:hypothetical protein
MTSQKKQTSEAAVRETRTGSRTRSSSPASLHRAAMVCVGFRGPRPRRGSRAPRGCVRSTAPSCVHRETRGGAVRGGAWGADYATRFAPALGLAPRRGHQDSDSELRSLFIVVEAAGIEPATSLGIIDESS